MDIRSGSRDNQLLSSDQVIDRLLAEPSVRHKASTCVLPAVRLGTEWRFRLADLDDWIALQQEPLALSSRPVI
jgi:hypothetical protein